MSEQCAQHGTFNWNELQTTDVAGAKAFYTKLFGWETEDLTTPVSYTVVKVGGQGIGGIMALPPDAPAGRAPMWGPYVAVDDVDATAQLARQLGARVLMEPQDIPDVGRFCVIQDPQGAILNVITTLPM